MSVIVNKVAKLPRRASLRRQVLEWNLQRKRREETPVLAKHLQMSTENLVASDDDDSENGDNDITSSINVRRSFRCLIFGPIKNDSVKKITDFEPKIDKIEKMDNSDAPLVFHNKENGAHVTKRRKLNVGRKRLKGALKRRFVLPDLFGCRKESCIDFSELRLAELELNDDKQPPCKIGKADSDPRPKPPAAPLLQRKVYVGRVDSSIEDISF